MLKKFVSGGQTGDNQAAWGAAKAPALGSRSWFDVESTLPTPERVETVPDPFLVPFVRIVSTPWYADNRYKSYKLTEAYGVGLANEP